MSMKCGKADSYTSVYRAISRNHLLLRGSVYGTCKFFLAKASFFLTSDSKFYVIGFIDYYLYVTVWNWWDSGPLFVTRSRKKLSTVTVWDVISLLEAFVWKYCDVLTCCASVFHLISPPSSEERCGALHIRVVVFGYKEIVRPRFDSRKRARDFSPQLPGRLWGFLSDGYWGALTPGVKLTTHLHLVPRSKIVELYLHSPIRLHGVGRNYLSRETYEGRTESHEQQFFVK
jgi:hypothetical protein